MKTSLATLAAAAGLLALPLALISGTTLAQTPDTPQALQPASEAAPSVQTSPAGDAAAGASPTPVHHYHHHVASPTPTPAPSPTPKKHWWERSKSSKTPKPSPSPSASPKATPRQKPSPAPEPSPKASPTPKATPAPKPSPTPKVEATPEPNPTPKATPAPKASPTPEATPEPTPRHKATPSPSPSATPKAKAKGKSKGFFSLFGHHKKVAPTTPSPSPSATPHHHKAQPTPAPGESSSAEATPSIPASASENAAPKSTPAPPEQHNINSGMTSTIPFVQPAPGSQEEKPVAPVVETKTPQEEEAEITTHFEDAKTKAMQDQEVLKLQRQADAAAGPKAKDAIRKYYETLYDRMRDIDPTIKDRIDRTEAATMRRVDAANP